ncbi:hypothetical protein M2A_0386 [Tepidicaulis marinus]|uniref:Uncharacterized protein n=1 Tax=Tepidicaulis marinus TaxID=1333998 RepID=A0A081B769_9HYPH|nr:hypothetical protein M2A_0386 [Tepidicaulis marinus]
MPAAGQRKMKAAARLLQNNPRLVALPPALCLCAPLGPVGGMKALFSRPLEPAFGMLRAA